MTPSDALQRYLLRTATGGSALHPARLLDHHRAKEFNRPAQGRAPHAVIATARSAARV